MNSPAFEATCAEVTAALAALAARGDVLEGSDPERIAQIVEWIGDGLRLGARIPATLARWLDERTVRELEQVIEIRQRDLEELPTFVRPAEPDDDYLVEHAARGRDRAESLKIGLVRACIGRGIAPITLQGFGRWCDVLEGMAPSFAALGREATLAGLGNRRWMLVSDDWTSALPSLEVVSEQEPPLSDEAESARAVHPPPAAIVAYAARGGLARWIERVADADPAFAELLEGAIDDLRVEPMQSLAAQRWLARRRRQDAIGYMLRPPRQARASTQASAGEREPIEARLGRLHPVAADARLLGYPDAIELRVTADRGAVRSVQLGDQLVEQPDADGVWVLRVVGEATRVPLALVVVGASGERCEALLRIDDAG